jgi:mannose-1-phosphate guanylyltransferase/phosphomannomutase
LRARDFKVVIDYSYGASSLLMPNVLPKIGASVLAINPFASTASATTVSDDPGEYLARIGDLVRTSGSDLGFVFDPDGETATIIDDRGSALSTEEALLVLVTLVCETHEHARLGLPVSVSRAAERIAAQHGATITWTKLSAAHLMEVADSGAVDFAASQEGGFIWPDFLPAYDAAATLLKLLDLLARTGYSLSALRERAPDVHVSHELVPTPWERKGAVMRGIVERVQDEPTVLVDGVKIEYPEGWALVLPDPEQPLTHVWAEGDTDADAKRLVAMHAGWIAELVR